MMIKAANISMITRSACYVLCFGCVSLLVSGCDLAVNTLKADREAHVEIQDYRDGFSSRLPEVEDNDSAYGASNRNAIPSLRPYMAQGTTDMKSVPLVSIAVNQTVPLRDVLFELAKQAEMDLELDPSIRGSIIFTARERPLDEVIERISDIAGLRYTFSDNVLRVEVDRPYNKTYKIDYLSYIRTNSGSIRNNIAVVSGDGADTGSDYQVTSAGESNFWGELAANLEQILGGKSISLVTSSSPRITATDRNPELDPTAPTPAEGQESAQQQEPVLVVESLPVDEEEDEEQETDNTFTLNKQAGLISVYAPEKKHKAVRSYLEEVRRATTAQVLVEAKVLEVALTDRYANGINWRAINLFGGEGYLQFLTTNHGAGTGLLNTLDTSSAPALTTTGGSNFVAGFLGNDAEAVIEALSEFGTVRALASPRLTVLNNQPAVLNVATNEVYFEIDIDVQRDLDTNTTQTEIESEIRNVPVGVLLNVMPSVDLERQTIAMALRPTVTSINARVEDPGVAFVIADCGANCANLSPNEIPQIDVQEIDSVIQVNSGQAIVMGGLLRDEITNAEDGVPGLSEVPMVGSLFKRHEDTVSKTELVIFLKATILDSPGQSIHNTDRDIYRRFSSDRRPFKL